MRLAFMGTPDFSVPALTELIAAGHEIAAVYTQPARPAGRGQKLRVSPVEALARQQGLEVRTPENFKSPEARAAFQALDLEVAVVVAYGLILPLAILEAPGFGCLNLHGSLLPRWRGAAPVQRAIMAGDPYTGVQVMQMEKGLDTGPVLLSETVAIRATDTSASLHERLSHIGADLLPRALAALSRGALVATPQAGEGVTYAHKISPGEARIDWSRPATEVDCHIRGLSPFPGGWFEIPGQGQKSIRCKALLSSVAKSCGSEGVPPGTVLSTGACIEVACGQGVIALHKLQKSGKTIQNAEEFLCGTILQPGQELS